jgi:hypothetical protein
LNIIDKSFSWINSIISRGVLSTVLWFIEDFVFRYKIRLLVIMLLGLGAASIQGSILLVINSLISKSENLKNLYEIFLQLNIEISLEWLLFLLILCGLIASATFVFLQANLTLGLWRRYQIFVSNQLLNALSSAIRRGLSVDSSEIKSTPITAVLKNAQRMGAFTRLVTNGILPVMRFSTFSLVAFYIHPIITTLIFFIAVPLGVMLLLVSAKVASGSDYDAEVLALASSKEIEQRVDNVIHGSDYHINALAGSNDSAITQRLDKTLGSLIAAERTRYFASILTISVLAMVTIFSGVLTNEVNAGEFLVYLVALIMAFSQLSNVLAIGALFGRFYPTVYRYKEVYSWLSKADSGSNINHMLSKSSYKYNVNSSDTDVLL